MPNRGIDVLIPRTFSERTLPIMIELERENIFEDSDYESIDLDDGNPNSSAVFPGFTKTDYIDRVKFERLPDENRLFGKLGGTDRSADPIFVYYRSLKFEKGRCYRYS